ncbi:hypothetical protein [Flaviaesturariibacter terrae]
MKKTLFMLIALAGTLLGRAQETLSEEESQKIVQSAEYGNALQARMALVETVYAAIERGHSADELQQAFNAGVDKSDYGLFYALLFGGPEEGNSFVRRFSDAQAAFFKAFPVLQKYQDAATCKSCPIDPKEQFAYLLKNIKAFHELQNLSNAQARNIAGGPTCGSYWKQLLVLGCGAACSVTGPAALFCGYKCWCEFCHDNSVLANLIC